ARDHPLRRQARTDLVPVHPRPPWPDRPDDEADQRSRLAPPPRPEALAPLLPPVKLVSTFVARGQWYHGLRRVELPMTVELDEYGEFDVREEPLPESVVSVVTHE